MRAWASSVRSASDQARQRVPAGAAPPPSSAHTASSTVQAASAGRRADRLPRSRACRGSDRPRDALSANRAASTQTNAVPTSTRLRPSRAANLRSIARDHDQAPVEQLFDERQQITRAVGSSTSYSASRVASTSLSAVGACRRSRSARPPGRARNRRNRRDRYRRLVADAARHFVRAGTDDRRQADLQHHLFTDGPAGIPFHDNEFRRRPRRQKPVNMMTPSRRSAAGVVRA